MAFDGHRTPFGNSLLPPYVRQASVNIGGGNGRGGALPFSMPGVSLQGPDATSYRPRGRDAHDDPRGLNNHTQSSTKSSKPADNTDEETDLQGLVSNILDEADSQDSYLSEGSLTTCNSAWSPKTLREEQLQYFQSEDKTHRHATFPPNHVSSYDLSKAQGRSEDKHLKDFYQQPNGLVSSQPWLLNLPNGDGDGYAVRPQKLPPGLPVPNAGNAYLSQMQQGKYDSMSADKDRGDGQPLKYFPAISDVFRPRGTMNGPCFRPYNGEHYAQSGAAPTSEYAPRDINQLAHSFQSLMAGGHDSMGFGDFPNMHRQSVALDRGDGMVERWKLNGPAVSTPMAPDARTPQAPTGKMGTVQMRRDGGVGNQASPDLPEFSPQNAEYYQHPKSTAGSFSLPNQYRNAMAMRRVNSSYPVAVSANRYPQHQIQWGQTPSWFQPQPQNEKRRMNMNMPGYGVDVSTRPTKQTPPQHFDHSRSAQCQKVDAENGIMNAGNKQQFTPAMYPANDPRKNAGTPINYTNFSPRHTLPNGSSIFGTDPGGKMSANESVASKPFGGGTMARRGENPYHGVVTDTRASALINESRPVTQIHLYLTECYDQWSCLERERQKTEAILKTFPGKRAAAVTKANPPQTPPNPTGVEHLIANQMREQGRVESLVNKMELLNTVPLHINLYTALNTHSMAISSARLNWVRHKEADASEHQQQQQQQQRIHLTGDRGSSHGNGTPSLVGALKDLAATTRKLRLALWHALQMTVARPAERQDRHADGEATAADGCPSPFEGYTFKF